MPCARSHHRLSQLLGRFLSGSLRGFRRWLVEFSKNPSPVRSPEIDAYQALARLRRRRASQVSAVAAARQSASFVGAAVDDPQVNLRITL